MRSRHLRVLAALRAASARVPGVRHRTKDALIPWLAAGLALMLALRALITEGLWPRVHGGWRLVRDDGWSWVRHALWPRIRHELWPRTCATTRRAAETMAEALQTGRRGAAAWWACGRRGAAAWWTRMRPRLRGTFARSAATARRAAVSAAAWLVWSAAVALATLERGAGASSAWIRGVLLPRLDALDRAAVTSGAAWTRASRSRFDAVRRASGPVLRMVLTRLRGGGLRVARALRAAAAGGGLRVARALRAAAAGGDRGNGARIARQLGLVGGAAASVVGAVAVTAVAVALLGPQTAGLLASAVEVELEPPGAFPPLAERSTVTAADGATLAVLHGTENREVVPLEDIPEHVRAAVITAEDRRFYDHGGYDPVALGRAAGANLEATAVVQGGSTITQQLAKLNYVGDSRSLDRKAQELVHAVGLEEVHDKDSLLERYLNQVYFGSGAYGVAAAAEEFFRATPDELAVEEAALLAAQIRAPGAADPRADADAAKLRRDQVLRQMVADGHLSADEGRAAQEQPVEVEPRLERDPSEPYVVEAVKREFLANPAFGETREERVERLFSGGLRIETALDPDVQVEARETVAAHEEHLGGPQAALAAVEPGTGRVLAIAAGGDFDERKFDLAVQGRRQPGSAFKTFALLAALENGVPPDVRLDGNGPAEHDLPAGQAWEVHNFGGAQHGPVSLEQALVQSVNTAFAELTLDVGHEEVIDVATRLGIDEGAFGEPSTHGPAIALGGLTHGVSPLELAAAYAALADDGRYAEPFLIERVLGPDGEPLFEQPVEPEQALEPQIAATAHDMLATVVSAGTGQAAQLPDRPVAGKTGTSQNSADAWFVGVTAELSTAVWVGHPDARTAVTGLTGGSTAAPVWRDFVAGVLDVADGEGYTLTVAD